MNFETNLEKWKKTLKQRAFLFPILWLKTKISKSKIGINTRTLEENNIINGKITMSVTRYSQYLLKFFFSIKGSTGALEIRFF